MPSAIRAVIFDAGHTLLEMDYPELTAYLRSRGHAVDERAVVDAERRARIRLDTERAAQPAAGRTGEGRYVRYLMEHLAITDESERHAVAEWRRGFNIPVGLCHRPDPEAARALRRARRARLVIGVLSNSNGSVRRALERAGLARYLDLVVDSSEVSMAKPDPRIFELAVDVTGVSAAETVYVGDSYFVDVVGARRAGLGAILFDPGRLWGDRDCPVVTGLCAAVDLIVPPTAARPRPGSTDRRPPPRNRAR